MAGGALLFRPDVAQTGQKLLSRIRVSLPHSLKNLIASVKPATHPAATVPATAATGVTVDGIVISRRPSATLGFKGRTYTVMVGDELELPFTGGGERVRCEKIEGQSVWLVFLRNQARAELKLSSG